MMKECFNLSVLLLGSYWRIFLVWMLLQLIFFSGFHYFTYPRSGYFPFSSFNLETIVIGFGILIALGMGGLVLGLGRLFTSSNRSSWLRQLPFRASSLNLVPLFLIVFYGLCILFFIPWGAFSAGLSFFVIGLPVLNFLILKNTENLMIGIFKALVVTLILCAFWFSFVYDWTQLKDQLYVELVVLIWTTMLWLLFGRSERLYSVGVMVAMATCLLIQTTVLQLREPKNFSEAVLSHNWFPTIRTWEAFKKYSLEPKNWSSVDQYRLPSYVRVLSQNWLDEFSHEEKIIFIENIHLNTERWTGKEILPRRPYQFSAYPQPTIRFSNYSRFPIGRDNVDAKLAGYLYENWEDTALFCTLLPFEMSERYIEKIFFAEGCGFVAFNQGVWSLHSIVESGELDQYFENALLRVYEEAPADTRKNMLFYLKMQWMLRKVKVDGELKYEKFENRLFSQEPLTKELLAEMKLDRSKVLLDIFQHVPNSKRDTYLEEINEVSVWLQDELELPILTLSQFILDDTNSFLMKKLNQKRNFYEIVHERLASLYWNGGSVWIYWLQTELLKQEHWPKAEKLLKHVEAMRDLGK